MCIYLQKFFKNYLRTTQLPYEDCWVTFCPPSHHAHRHKMTAFFSRKKIVMLCPPSRNVCLYFKIIVTLCPLPQNIHRFIKNIVTFLSAHYKCPQKVCFVYLRLCISACSKFLFLHNVYQEFWTVYVDLLNTAENFAFFFNSAIYHSIIILLFISTYQLI